MIIVGRRVQFRKTLASYLLSRENNEAVFIRQIENYPGCQLSAKILANALRLMQTQALAKGRGRTLYHVILALPQGEKVTSEQLKIALDTLTDNLKLTGHQRIVVEHHKSGRQHFHIIYNILNPMTGILTRLEFNCFTHRRTAIELERKFGLTPSAAKGRAVRLWERFRSKQSGIDPRQIRKEITAIFKDSRTGAEFIAALTKAGCSLSIGKYNSYVIVDKAGDVHGLMRHIEGTRLADLERKFPDLKTIKLPPLDSVRQKLRKSFPRKKIARDCRAASHLLKRNPLRSRAPALSRPAPARPLLKNGLKSLLAPPRRPGYRKEVDVRAYAPLPHRKPKIHLNEAAKANFPDPEFERAELIAWQIESSRIESLRFPDGANIKFTRLMIRRGDAAQLVYYWFDERGRDLTETYKAKWYLLEDSILMHRTDGALIRLSTMLEVNESEADAARRLNDFLATVYPHIPSFIPGPTAN